jgi:group II intron reverse transcriptase/maturase
LKDKNKYKEGSQLPKEDYLQENKLEIEGKVEVSSIYAVSEEGRNDTKTVTNKLLEKILSKDNMNQAYKRVKANKGASGIDGKSVDELLTYLKENGNQIKEEIRSGKYKPQAVRRVEIPKPDGSMRKLGIPTVVDRVIQQSIAQQLNTIYEPIFSENSYGFRPNRSCHNAILKAKEIINEGNTWVVDIDLEKFFDTVNQDLLISIIRRDVKEDKVLKLIRKYLQAGVLENGVFAKTETGTPQGGNISPILSNIMLNELDKELEKRDLRFVRYADDLEIFVKSEKAAKRVMQSITEFIEKKLRLKVNKSKSKIKRPKEIKYLGFSFYQGKSGIEIRVHPKSIAKLKTKIKEITGRSNAMSMQMKYKKLKEVITGWVNYFKVANMKGIAQKLDEWIRRRIRMCYWKQWKKVKTKYENLKKLGIENSKAWEYANTRKSYWRTSNSPILTKSLTNKKLENFGYTSLTSVYCK